MSRPDLLIFDEPLDGLDVASRQQLSQRLGGLSGSACTLVLILNRFEDIPDYIDRVGILVDCALTCTGSCQSLLEEALVAQLAHLNSLQDLALPEVDQLQQQASLLADQPLIILRDGMVPYPGPTDFASSGLGGGSWPALADGRLERRREIHPAQPANRRPSAGLQQ